MIHDVVNLIRIELMQNRYSDGSIGDCCEESNSPVRTITSANGDFVAFTDSAVFKCDMQLFYLSRYIVVL